MYWSTDTLMALSFLHLHCSLPGALAEGGAKASPQAEKSALKNSMCLALCYIFKRSCGCNFIYILVLNNENAVQGNPSFL